MEQVVLSKRTKDGKAIEVRMRRYIAETYVLDAYVDGERVAVSEGLRPLRAPKGDLTHYINGKPAVGLTTADANVINEAIAVAVDAERETPEGRIAILREEREDIACRYMGALDEIEDRKARAMESESLSSLPVAGIAEWQAKAEASRQELAAFDDEHPEVVAAIKAEKAEATRRFLASD